MEASGLLAFSACARPYWRQPSVTTLITASESVYRHYAWLCAYVCQCGVCVFTIRLGGGGDGVRWALHHLPFGLCHLESLAVPHIIHTLYKEATYLTVHCNHCRPTWWTWQDRKGKGRGGDGGGEEWWGWQADTKERRREEKRQERKRGKARRKKMQW